MILSNKCPQGVLIFLRAIFFWANLKKMRISPFKKIKNMPENFKLNYLYTSFDTKLSKLEISINKKWLKITLNHYTKIHSNYPYIKIRKLKANQKKIPK